jgi:hypothetical protein
MFTPLVAIAEDIAKDVNKKLAIIGITKLNSRIY